ncbi:MAG: HDOD domain-containing protein [Negativicutes bacterium]
MVTYLLRIGVDDEVGRSILFVDDERSMLKAMERFISECECEVFVAESGEKGLKILENKSIDIVVSALRIMVMDGHQFLRKVQERYPGTSRIILSEFASENELFTSIIDGSNSLYLFRPWSGEELKNKIGKLLEARELFRSFTMLTFADKLGNLSMITGIYNSVCRLIEQDVDVSVIAKVIETDPAVAASVLRIVNFSFYNIKTGSIIQSIAYLGLPVIKSIVLFSCLLQSVNIQVPPFTTSRLTNHASQSNRIMAAIYSKVYERQLPDNLATAGLLHNIGFIMFLHYYPEEYKELLQEYLLSDSKSTLQTLEKETFGVTHNELGGYLLNWWGQPYSIVECALFHNNPTNGAVIEPEPLIAVYLASNYAWNHVFPELPIELDSTIFSRIGIAQQQFEKSLALT